MTQRTLDAYQLAISAFHQWASSSGIKVTKNNLDAKVVQYMTYMCEKEGAEPRVGAYLIYGLQLLKCEVPKNLFLPCAKESLASWRKQRPGSMQLPVAEEILFDVAVHVGAKRLDMALLMLLQYDCCLRPSEAISLTKDHVVPPAGGRYSKWAIIVSLSEFGERSKTGTSDDSVIVGDLKDRRWMQQVISHLYRSADFRLFPRVDLGSYERHLAEACNQLEYSAVIVLPHIIRHSSASNDAFFKRRDLRSIQKRGRWASKASVNRYEKHGLMMRQWKFIPAHRLAKVQSSPKRLVSFLNTRLTG